MKKRIIRRRRRISIKNIYWFTLVGAYSLVFLGIGYITYFCNNDGATSNHNPTKMSKPTSYWLQQFWKDNDLDPPLWGEKRQNVAISTPRYELSDVERKALIRRFLSEFSPDADNNNDDEVDKCLVYIMTRDLAIAPPAERETPVLFEQVYQRIRLHEETLMETEKKNSITQWMTTERSSIDSINNVSSQSFNVVLGAFLGFLSATVAIKKKQKDKITDRKSGE